MITYKITNISNLLGKRDPKFNSTIDIEYIDNMIRKNKTLAPNASLFLTVSSLPMSIHTLRAKNLITVTEINKSELDSIMEINKPKVSPIVEKVKEETKVENIEQPQPTKKSKKSSDL